jgi:hypothetical protein
LIIITSLTLQARVHFFAKNFSYANSSRIKCASVQKLRKNAKTSQYCAVLVRDMTQVAGKWAKEVRH